PLVAGVHAGDPDTMSVRSSFPRFVDMEQKYGSLIRGMLNARRQRQQHAPAGNQSMFMTMKTGLKDLIDILRQQSSGVNFKTGVGAQSIQRTSTGRIESYTVTLSNSEQLQADGIILAVPAYVSAALISSMGKDLPDLLLSIPYVSTATVSLAYKKDSFGHTLKGFGFVVPRKENRRIMAATWTSSKFSFRSPDDSVLLRFFVGGTANQEMVFKSDDEIAGLVRAELKDIMGVTAEPLFVRIYRWDRAMPQYTIGHGSRIKTIEQLTAGLGNIQLCGSAYHGIGISDCINSGNTAAQSVLKGLFD
ncbi:MAG: protoporphyrinogen oxidase, partial [Deltaproteobacteria bacterium]|nr:protoporphyrinogen oxidase [Deltaproteobacteria bacterium]